MDVEHPARKGIQWALLLPLFLETGSVKIRPVATSLRQGRQAPLQHYSSTRSRVFPTAFRVPQSFDLPAFAVSGLLDQIDFRHRRVFRTTPALLSTRATLSPLCIYYGSLRRFRQVATPAEYARDFPSYYTPTF